MNWSINRMGVAGAVLVAAGLAVALDAPVTNLRVPLEFYEDGTLKTQVVAAHAILSEEREITGSDVRIERYGRSGNMENRIIAENCTVDREKKTAVSTGKVRLEGRGMLILGSGLEWSAEEQRVIITNSPRVVLRRQILAGRETGGKP